MIHKFDKRTNRRCNFFDDVSSTFVVLPLKYIARRIDLTPEFYPRNIAPVDSSSDDNRKVCTKL